MKFLLTWCFQGSFSWCIVICCLFLTVHNVFLARRLYGRTPIFSRGSYEILVDNNCRIGDWVTWYRNFTTEISIKNSLKHVKAKYACKKKPMCPFTCIKCKPNDYLRKPWYLFLPNSSYFNTVHCFKPVLFLFRYSVGSQPKNCVPLRAAKSIQLKWAKMHKRNNHSYCGPC